ncbi:peroxisomal biogenesis factor 11-domain-containing protein [Podospora appendiculata]|uniref:Peroxisomal biogenesis factor 11-domain-containing protein n=1 Tax=Podospora appendiculata TaxID=314037 RepID=A0AAE0XFX3_9PEZI|nr:peroxisomal biogenesis factor 11-domain-containing protein [Podospora appendiculata]
MATPRGYTTFEQFIKFATDASGLERTFRLFQALLQILAFNATARSLTFSLLTFLLPLFLPNTTVTTNTSAETYIPLFLALRARFASGRRFLRLFRFLEAFHSAWALYYTSSPTAAHRPAEAWLDVFARAFNGLYLLLESATFPGAALGTDVWAVGTRRVLDVEAQRLWFLALLCGAGGGAVRLWKTGGVVKEEVAGEKAKAGVVGEKAKKRREAAREAKSKYRRVARRFVADVLDLAVPGSVIEVFSVEQGTVGLAMFGSTVLTGLEVWERCGRELAAAAATAVKTRAG